MGVLGLSKNKGISLLRRGREFGEWEFWVFQKTKGFPSGEGGGSFGEIVERSTI
jgi:hypothetical protein